MRDWQPGQLPPDRTGVVFGSEMLYCEPEETASVYDHCIENGQFHAERWGRISMSEMYPLWMLMYLPNMVACHIGIAHDARGPNNTICQGEASSLLALIEAALIIERGHADVMITGGSSSRVTGTSMLYRGVDHLSRRIDTPQSACRPFDATRDGMVNGEGAAAFRAGTRGIRRRTRRQDPGARDRLGHVVRRAGFAHVHSRSGDPAFHRENAGHVPLVGPRRGTCQRPRDADPCQVMPREAQAIHTVLGGRTGDGSQELLWESRLRRRSGGDGGQRAGTHHGRIPATLNYSQPDPTCPVNVVAGESLAGSACDSGRPQPVEHGTGRVRGADRRVEQGPQAPGLPGPRRKLQRWSLEPGAWSPLRARMSWQCLDAWSLCDPSTLDVPMFRCSWSACEPGVTIQEPGAWSLEPGAWSLEPGATALRVRAVATHHRRRASFAGRIVQRTGRRSAGGLER